MELMYGLKPVHRDNPQAGESEWYYYDPRGTDNFSDMKKIDVPSENSPHPYANEIQNYLYENDRYNYNQLYGTTPPPITQPAQPQTGTGGYISSQSKSNLWDKIKDEVVRNATFYPVGYAIGSLHAAKQEMDGVNKKGYDNYAHRLGMAQIGQESNRTPAAYMWGDMLGQVKEMYDLDKKTLQGNNIIDTIGDGMKDLGNNDEGLNWGRNNPDKNPRSWLKNLDYKHNVWIK